MKNQAFFRIRALAILFALLAAGFMSVPATGWANNVTVTNVNYLDATNEVEFDVSWDNSWRNTGTSGSSMNYDGVWVFVKFRHACADDSLNPSSFQHMWLSQTVSDHTIPAGSSLEVGSTSISGTPRGMGLFLYRAADGTGTHTMTGVKVKWDKTAQGVTGVDWDVRVYAIEMVYIPTAAYYVGDASNSYYFKDGGTTNPLKITSENALTMGTATGNLNQSSTNLSGSLPAAFPKGYGAFWVMKYEITQDQYVSFLNSLNRYYQNAYTYTSLPPGTMTTPYPYVMYYSSGSASMQYRNGIRCPVTFHSTKPITFYCDLNQNGIANEAADGQTLACNYLYTFHRNFLDWACLRLMSEMEYEKICRGPDYAYGGLINNEMPWALNGSISTNFTYVNNVTNTGAYNEIPANTGVGLFHGGNQSPAGPRRVGSTHTPAATREQAGSSYYGVTDMAGNLWDAVMRVNTGSTFARTDHGDGNVGNSYPSTWLIDSWRGGSWVDSYSYACVSQRVVSNNQTSFSSQFGSIYYERMGARGAR